MTEFQFGLSHSQQVMGWALNVAGKPAEALAAFERALATMQRLADINPNVTRWQSELAFSLESIGGLQLKDGQDRGSGCLRTPGHRNLESAVVADTL